MNTIILSQTPKLITDIKLVLNSELKSKEIVLILCDKCKQNKQIKVSNLRYYFRNKNSEKYVCHACKMKEIGSKIRQLIVNRKDYVDDVMAVCSVCQKQFRVRSKNMLINKKRNNGEYQCNACSMSLAHKNGKFNAVYTNDFKNKLNNSSKEFWKEARPTWKSKLVTEEFKKQMSICGKRTWAIEGYRKRMEALRSTPEFKAKLSQWSKMAWTDEFKEKVINFMINGFASEIGKMGWKKLRSIYSPELLSERFANFGKMAWTSEFKEKMALVRLNQPRTSTQQEILYSILNDLNVKFFDDKSVECAIGWHTFDCRIDPQSNISLKKSLLIEVQGDYWHSLKHTVIKDKSKATYLKTYFPEFDLKYLWEHEFNSKDRVVETVKYWLGLSQFELISFSFDKVELKEIEAREAELFVSKFHYAGRIGRSGVNLGFFLGDVLIAVCIYASPVRQEVAAKQGFSFKEVLELSRFCIHPKYQVRNLASFLIARSIEFLRRVKPNIRCLVSFADSTYNHLGTIYKASNWRLDGEVAPDYWYADNRGYVCHKKTLWNKAKQMSMTEFQYCEKFGFSKVWGGKKFRYVYELG